MGFEKGDVVGHEFMGDVVEVGSAVTSLKVGDRVVVPFPIACGACEAVRQAASRRCATTAIRTHTWSKPRTATRRRRFTAIRICSAATPAAKPSTCASRSPTSARSRSKATSPMRRCCSSATFCRPDIKRPSSAASRRATSSPYGAADPSDNLRSRAPTCSGRRRSSRSTASSTAAIWPRVSAARSPSIPTRVNVVEFLREQTGGRGPDACIDAVGMEAHGVTAMAALDQVKQAVQLETDRPHVLREMIHAAGKGATLSLAGVYTGFVDAIPMGAAFGKGLTFKMGQTNVHRYLQPLFERIEKRRDRSERDHHASLHARRCSGSLRQISATCG